MKKDYLLILLVSLLTLFSCGEKKVPFPQPDVKIQEGWITFSTGNDGGIYQIFSTVGIDSSAYIANIQTSFKEKQSIYGDAYNSYKVTWLIDTSLTKIKQAGIVYYDSLGNVVYSTNKQMDWKFVTPGTMGAAAAEYAQIIYNNANNLQPVSKPVIVDYGHGDWHNLSTKDDFLNFFNDDIIETPTSYLVWMYTCFTKFQDKMIDEYAWLHGSDKRLIFGELRQYEVLKETKKLQMKSMYYVDKFGDVFYECPEEYADSNYYEYESLWNSIQESINRK